MKRAWVLLAAAVALGLAAACREYMPANRYLQRRPASRSSLSTADARHKFSHARHHRHLERAGVTCLDCHRFDQQIETGNEQHAASLSSAGLYPGSSACHFCHGPSDDAMASAPAACTTCHENLMPLLPANHEVGWAKAHAAMAGIDQAECRHCHRDAFCINCHQRRDSIQTIVHERNFLSFHSIEARANPVQCGSCHRQDFCINCHARERSR
jgi:hypothetical protein